MDSVYADVLMQMDANRTHCIRVGCQEPTQPGLNVFQILATLLPVRFRFEGSNDSDHCKEVSFREEPSSTSVAKESSVSSLSLPKSLPSLNGARMEAAEVRFADDPEVPFPFRARTLISTVPCDVQALAAARENRVLATIKRGPVWTVCSAGGSKQFQSSFPLPSIPADGNLRDAFNGDRFLELLPALHFLHDVCAESRYEGPPLRACFMFDDPNLHWPSYGYVNYREIAAQAAKENYHVSFATVPLDNWFTHKRAAEVFREHPRQLSMLIHGNEHTHRELAQPGSQAERMALLLQAVRRIERLENKAGFPIARVMAAPHGACSDDMLEALTQCGFESATISHGSLRAHNRSKSWTKCLGYLPSELVRECPVLPRWRLAANATNTVLLAAYLKQPIILVGHHQDLKGGTDLLDSLAGFINGLGKVSWEDMTGLSRSNYLWRMDGSTLRVKPLGRRLTVQLPKAATQLAVENPFHHSWRSWQISGDGKSSTPISPGEVLSLPDSRNCQISVETQSRTQVWADGVSRRQSLTALVRRLATEARDRLFSLA